MFVGMPEQLAGRLSVASLNTRGVHVLGSQLAGRYAAIGTAFEAGPAEVACFQEVHRLHLDSRWGQSDLASTSTVVIRSMTRHCGVGGPSPAAKHSVRSTARPVRPVASRPRRRTSRTVKVLNRTSCPGVD